MWILALWIWLHSHSTNAHGGDADIGLLSAGISSYADDYTGLLQMVANVPQHNALHQNSISLHDQDVISEFAASLSQDFIGPFSEGGPSSMYQSGASAFDHQCW